MKNRNIIFTIGAMLIVIVMALLYMFKHDSIDESILNKNWYKYNYYTGYYEVLNISEKNITYTFPESTKYKNEFDGCSTYNYNKKNKTLVLDCSKNIKILEFNDESISLIVDGENEVFFKDINASLNYEFERVFNMSISQYNEEKSQVTEFIKISPNKISEIYNESNESLIVFMGDNCSNIECTIFKSTLEQWISVKEEVYFIDSNSITDLIAKKLNKINTDFSSNKDDYNDSYPTIYKVGNKKIYETYKIKCTGFNCTNYQLK